MNMLKAILSPSYRGPSTLMLRELPASPTNLISFLSLPPLAKLMVAINTVPYLFAPAEAIFLPLPQSRSFRTHNRNPYLYKVQLTPLSTPKVPYHVPLNHMQNFIAEITGAHTGFLAYLGNVANWNILTYVILKTSD